ncbi:MAG: Stf0 family sulfotransferase [Bacteroidota bacterium]
MRPKLTYRIWFTPRTGSTLLCKGLEETCIAGCPGEFFNLVNNETLLEKYEVQNYAQLKEKIWQLGSSPNGIFGIKHSWHRTHHQPLFEELRQLQTLDYQISKANATQDLFPNAKHIFLTRRNKIRQAVSWWRAINNGVWHLEENQRQQDQMSFFEAHYNFDALHHLFREASLRECAIQAYFTAEKIQPLTLIYEDMTADFPKTINQIIEYLEINHQGYPKPTFHYRRTADELSELWVERFRQEIQEKMGHFVW